MAREGKGSRQRSRGIVRAFDAVEGIGVIDSPDTPGGCFVHYATIDGSGYRELTPHEVVEFVFESLDFLQDGYPFRTIQVWRLG